MAECYALELIVTDCHQELKTLLYWNDIKLPGKLQFQFKQLLQPWNNYCGLWSWMETWPCGTDVAKGTHHGISAWRAPLESLCIDRSLAVKMTLRGLLGIMNWAFLPQRGKQIWMVFSGCILPHGALLAAEHPGWLKCIQGPDWTSHTNKVSLGERKHLISMSALQAEKVAVKAAWIRTNSKCLSLDLSYQFIFTVECSKL